MNSNPRIKAMQGLWKSGEATGASVITSPAMLSTLVLLALLAVSGCLTVVSVNTTEGANAPSCSPSARNNKAWQGLSWEDIQRMQQEAISSIEELEELQPCDCSKMFRCPEGAYCWCGCSEQPPTQRASAEAEGNLNEISIVTWDWDDISAGHPPCTKPAGDGCNILYDWDCDGDYETITLMQCGTWEELTGEDLNCNQRFDDDCDGHYVGIQYWEGD